MKHLTLWIVVVTLAGCTSPHEIKINPGKQGGLYEYNQNGKLFRFYSGPETVSLDTATVIPMHDVVSVIRSKSQYGKGDDLVFQLNDAGAANFEKMTERNVQRQVYIVVNNHIMSAPTVMSSIPNGKVLLSMSDPKDIDAILNYLQR